MILFRHDHTTSNAAFAAQNHRASDALSLMPIRLKFPLPKWDLKEKYRKVNHDIRDFVL